MPIVDLLGVCFDMQLLAKLTVSAAAILFITWVFRFYNSRARDQTQTKNGLLPPRSTQPSPETSSPCKTVLTPLKERGKEEYDGQNLSSHSSEDSGQGILQLQKADGMVRKEENKAFEDIVTNIEETFWLFSSVECNIQKDEKEKNKEFKDFVTKTEGSFSLSSGVERNIDVLTTSEDIGTSREGNSLLSTGVERNVELDTKPEDTVTNTGEGFWLFSGAESKIEVDKIEEKKEFEDFVTKTDGSSSLSTSVERNIRVSTKSEYNVSNIEETFWLFTGVEQNIEGDKKEENKKIQDFVTSTSSLSSCVKRNSGVNTKPKYTVDNIEETFWLFSGVERNNEVDKKEKKKEIEDFVTNTDGSSSLPSGVERNTEVNIDTEDFVTNTGRHSSIPSGVDFNIEVDKKEKNEEIEDFVTNAEGCSSLASDVERHIEVDKKVKNKEIEDFVTNADGCSSLASGVERNIEVDKTEEKKETDDFVTNTDEGSSLPSGVKHNTEVGKKSKELVTNVEISPLSSSGVERIIKECKTTKNLLTSTEGNSAPSPGVEYTMEGMWDKAERGVKDGRTGLTLQTPGLDVKAAISPSGRRSPCQVKKLDGGVEVGRELRQNIGHPGMCSSFQSKAEIKVENADLVIERPGVKSTAVRGKIYDYFVETSSQSVSDLSPTHSISPTYGPYETNTLSNVMDKPRTPSPLPSSLIIRDVGFSNDSDRVSRTSIRSETRRVLRHGLIRKDSYLAAAEESELQIPFPPVTRSRSPALQSKCSSNSPESLKDMDELGWKSSEDPQVETLARAQFFHFPVENIGNSELESLTGKLDLGNCLEALMLAKKHGHNALQQAALRVMSDNYFQVLRDPNLYGRLKGGERDQIQRQRMRGRRCLMVADMDCPDWTRRPHQSTDSYTAKGSSGLYYYDDYKDSWHLQCQIPQEILSNGCAMCTMNNYLFVAVGFQWTVPSKKVFCYNPMTSIWSEICPMNEARPHCKLVALENYVYAIGGECLSTVERYDPRTNRWTFVASLPNETFAVAHRATACNGELFVSGGTLKYTLLRYNPKTNVWRQSLIVGSKERTTEMVAVRNCLYRFDVNPYIGISVYRYHVVARLWYECCSKQIHHCPAFQCVAMDDVIYCISRQFNMRFFADEKSPGFVADDLQILTAAKGILFPFVLDLPDKSTLQTSV